MVKSRDTEVAIVAAPLVVLIAVVMGIWVSVTGCGPASGRHFGSSDATLSTGSGGTTKPADTGGAPGSGGAVASGGGGTTAGSGGAAAGGSGGGTGGGPVTGGAPGTGGAVGTDAGADTAADGPATLSDARASGGMPGTGGGSGGRGTGGAGTGGAATGGAGTGGAATGGAATGGAATGGAATGGAATGGAATGGAATGGAGTGGAAAGGATVAKCRVVVNEIQTGTALGASDEFVELYNTCSLPTDLAGYSLNYRSAANNSGGADIALFVFGNDSQIPGNGFVVIAGTGFPGSAGGRFLTGGLAANGGAVGVRNAAGVVVDSVSYDTLTATNIFTEAFPAPNPPLTSSIVRAPDGADTDNNSRDFTTSLLASPGASNR